MERLTDADRLANLRSLLADGAINAEWLIGQFIASEAARQQAEQERDKQRFALDDCFVKIVDLMRDVQCIKEAKEAAEQQVTALRAALERLLESTLLPEQCEHENEPDYCDGCRYKMELAVRDARIHARAALAGSRSQNSMKALATFEPKPDQPTDDDIDPELRHE